MGFYSKFHTLFSSAKILKIGYDLTKLGRVYRWELLLRYSVVILTLNARYNTFPISSALQQLHQVGLWLR